MPFLFSYGTLQDPDVQRITFGRLLEGVRDELVGFERSTVLLADEAFVAAAGKAEFAIVRHAARADSRVSGTVFEVTDEELASADEYEPAPYVRVSTTLASGRTAWVYVDGRGRSRVG